MTTKTNKDPSERDLVRLVTGELDRDSAEALTLRISKDELLEARKKEITTTWQELELPPVAPVPFDFSDRVVATAVESSVIPLPWGTVPGWVRGVAALSLALGLLLGFGLARAGTTTEEVEVLGLAGDSFAGFEEEGL